jgi:hypothetical protein
MKGTSNMARSVGDTNHSLREDRLKAEIAKYKAKLSAEKVASKVKDAKIAELRGKLASAKKVAK